MYAPYREDATAKEIKNRSAIVTAFQSLFNTLSTWERNGELILDINIHPPSSSDQWLKSMTAMSDGADLQPSVPSITSVEELHEPVTLLLTMPLIRTPKSFPVHN